MIIRFSLMAIFSILFTNCKTTPIQESNNPNSNILSSSIQGTKGTAIHHYHWDIPYLSKLSLDDSYARPRKNLQLFLQKNGLNKQCIDLKINAGSTVELLINQAISSELWKKYNEHFCAEFSSELGEKTECKIKMLQQKSHKPEELIFSLQEWGYSDNPAKYVRLSSSKSIPSIGSSCGGQNSEHQGLFTNQEFWNYIIEIGFESDWIEPLKKYQAHLFTFSIEELKEIRKKREHPSSHFYEFQIFSPGSKISPSPEINGPAYKSSSRECYMSVRGSSTKSGRIVAHGPRKDVVEAIADKFCRKSNCEKKETETFSYLKNSDKACLREFFAFYMPSVYDTRINESPRKDFIEKKTLEDFVRSYVKNQSKKRN